MIVRPIRFQWDGDHMVPAARMKALCDKQFVVGEDYTLVVEEPRSTRTHNHYFACIHDAWLNLPEKFQKEFRTAEHLRKKALIHTGYHQERCLPCNSRKEALRTFAFIEPIDEYAVVLILGNVVHHYTAKSQSKKLMGAKVFQESKDAVLDWIARLIDVPREQLEDRGFLCL